MATDPTHSADAIRSQLKRIADNPAFKGTDKQTQFLRFVVEETLAGRADQIKGYSIAVSVYGRSKDFDPQVDPIVRVEAGRLRRSLERYYLTAGSNDPIRITIPKGAYVPTFQSVVGAAAKHHADRRIDKRRTRLARPSIAVIPLVNLTGDASQDYFVDGLTEEFTTELTRYQDFRVIASQSTMRFKGEDEDAPSIGRTLKVRFLLSGSVRKHSDLVKVTVRLVDTSNGAQIWGENYKRELTPSGLIDIQESIAKRVVGAIADNYGLISRRLSLESWKRAPMDMRAYDAVLRFYRYETELTPEAFRQAMEALERAIEIEPDYGMAWSMLGHLYADNYALGFCQIDTPLDKALTYAQRGIALAPENQFAADALALVYFHKGEKKLFLKHVDQTIALNPNSPYIIGVAGWHLTLYGEWERGLALLKKGMQLNPYHPSWFHLATYLDAYRRGDFESAVDEAIRFNFPGLYLDPLMRAAAHGQMGSKEEAGTALVELLRQVPDFETDGRQLVRRYVKVENLIDALFEGLKKAGLEAPG